MSLLEVGIAFSGLGILTAYLFGFYKGQQFERRHPGMISPFRKRKQK